MNTKLDKMLKKHQGSFRRAAWEEYTPRELTQWVALFTKRATHRTDKTKAMRDIQNAENYLSMLKAQLRGSLG